MAQIQFSAIPTAVANRFWTTGRDDYDSPIERVIAHGEGVPCRHCLEGVAVDEAYLILAFRPFPKQQAYAETGPIFLHAQPCNRYQEQAKAPAMFARRERFLLRGYNA